MCLSMPDVRLVHQELLGEAAALRVLAGRAAGGSTLRTYTGLLRLHPHIVFPQYVLMVSIKPALHRHISSQL